MENQPSWMLSWGLLWGLSWAHSWGHSWVKSRFRLLCASPTFRPEIPKESPRESAGGAFRYSGPGVRSVQKSLETVSEESQKQGTTTTNHIPPQLRWGKSPVANRYCSVNAVNSCRPFRCSMWNECCTDERKSHDSNRGTTNAGPMRTDFCDWKGDMIANER